MKLMLVQPIQVSLELLKKTYLLADLDELIIISGKNIF